MDALRRHDVDTIFGYPGGAILPIYDALHIAESEGWVKHILVRHEQAGTCLLYTSPSPRDLSASRMPSSA